MTTALLGLFVGSFLNVVIHRLPKMMELEWQAQARNCVAKRSPSRRCVSTWPRPGRVARTAVIRSPRSRNIPVVSFLVLRGRCRHCKAPIGVRYPIVEILTGVLSAFAAWRFGCNMALLGAFGLPVGHGGTDLHRPGHATAARQPDPAAALAGPAVQPAGHIYRTFVGSRRRRRGYLTLWSVYWLFKLVTGKEGMGYGDFKLLAAIGAWLGWQMLPLTILLSSAVGALVGISLIVFARHGRNVPIPFGPYLAAAGVLALFFGEDLTTRYLALL